MRTLIVAPALVLIGFALTGCNTGAPPGVLPRTPVPPPPSLAGTDSRRSSTGAQRSNAGTQPRAVTVPSTLSTPRPSSTAVEPVMTGTGVGAGFKF